jgi:hypothetical protein
VVTGGSGLIRGVTTGGSGLIREVVTDGSGLIRGVTIGGSGFMRSGLIRGGKTTVSRNRVEALLTKQIWNTPEFHTKTLIKIHVKHDNYLYKERHSFVILSWHPTKLIIHLFFFFLKICKKKY